MNPALRVSSYLIAASLPGQPFHLLLHGFNGVVDKVPSALGEYLLRRRGELFRDGQNAPPETSGATVDQLAARGYLTELDHEAERTIVMRIAAAIHEADLASHTASFIFVPTYTCNLRCPYCFQSHDMHAGRGQFSSLMTSERVDQAFAVIDRFSKPGAVAGAMGLVEPIGDSAETHSCVIGDREVTLFGGEPLLETTVPIVTYIIEQSSARGIAVTAISNGVELQHFRHLLGPGLLQELQITLDGPAHIHDQRRVGPGLPRTFETIATNIDYALAHGVKIGLRINVNAENAPYLDQLHNTFVERGWQGHPKFFANAATVHGSYLPAANRNLISGHELVQITTRLRKERAVNIDSYELTARRTLTSCIQGHGYPFRSAAFCSAETGMLIFDPLGDVYACWEEIGQPLRRIGTYGGDGIEFQPEMIGPWLARFPGAIEECSNCPYALIHRSGCAYQARQVNNTMFSAACANFQDYFPTSLADAYLDEERLALGDHHPASALPNT